MRPILMAMSPKRMELNALFIQPTRMCANNCKGCYVKEHTGTEQMRTPEFTNLFKLFYSSAYPETWTNQITLSVDVLPEEDSSERATHDRTCLIGLLWQFVHEIVRLKVQELKDEHPEVHITCHSPKSLAAYCLNTPMVEIAQAFDMISFSHLPQELSTYEYLSVLRERTHVNYNHLIPGNLNSDNIKEYVTKMERLAKEVDSIYLVLYKEPMGKEYTQLDFMRQKARLRHDIAVINSLRKLLSKDAWSKVQVDGCLQDISRYKQCGQQCSSNISRFQVWPDGSVSGCAYAFRPSGNHGVRGAGGVLENIRKARDYNEFRDWCYLHKVYNSLVG